MLTAIGDVMRKAYEKNWITTRDGNISLRKSIDGKITSCMYITPKGIRKTIIHPENIVKIPIKNKQPIIPEDQTPSTEFHMHFNLLVDAKTSRAVVHLHPTHVIAAMRAGINLQSIAAQFPELSRYTRVGPTVPSVPAGSKDLADLTNEALRGHHTGKIIFDIVGQEDHGVCAVGTDPWDAYEHIERLDHICEIVLKSGVY